MVSSLPFQHVFQSAYREGLHIVLKATEDVSARSIRCAANQKVGENHFVAVFAEWVLAILGE